MSKVALEVFSARLGWAQSRKRIGVEKLLVAMALRDSEDGAEGKKRQLLLTVLVVL
jgi:hypothetical protein